MLKGDVYRVLKPTTFYRITSIFSGEKGSFLGADDPTESYLALVRLLSEVMGSILCSDSVVMFFCISFFSKFSLCRRSLLSEVRVDFLLRKVRAL